MDENQKMIKKDVQKRLKQVGEIFRNKDIILDITSDSALSNPTINNLYNPKDGYIAWIDFLSNISSLNIFNKIYPTINGELGRRY